jgi:vanillate O-demethylase ferredoxin subunit
MLGCALALLPASNAWAQPTSNGPIMSLKLNIIGRRRAGMTLAEHRHHIRQVHGELVLRYIRAEPENAPRRYVQNAVFDGQYRATAPGVDPFALNRDFVTQIWLTDMAALERSRKTDFYNLHLKDDEPRFVDTSTVVFLPSREREVSVNGSVPAGAWKLFTLLQRAPGAEAGAFTAAWAEAASRSRSVALRHVQNDVLGRPGSAMPGDAIDEFWFDNESAARAQLAAWQAVLQEQLIRPGLAVGGSFVALMAREDVVHAGAI